MISWLTGARITNVVEDLQNNDMFDESQDDLPDTPAPLFAARAFKQAIFGTPKPEDRARARAVKAQSPQKVARKLEFRADKTASVLPSDGTPEGADTPESPTKLNSILITPGNGPSRRKTVSFGANVVDNEGRNGPVNSKSGLPNEYPGKFPSPWTPKTGLAHHTRNITTAAAAPQMPNPEPRTRDDSDITIDMTEPRSESGRFWKDRYMSYADKSEREMRRLVTKQQMAKSYARKKDEEVIQLTGRLVDEKRLRHELEQGMEAQIKDLKDRLRQVQAENLRLGAEKAGLKRQLGEIGSDTRPGISRPGPSPSSGGSVFMDEEPRPHRHKRQPSVRAGRARRNTAPTLDPQSASHLNALSTSATNVGPEQHGPSHRGLRLSQQPSPRQHQLHNPTRPSAPTPRAAGTSRQSQSVSFTPTTSPAPKRLVLPEHSKENIGPSPADDSKRHPHPQKPHALHAVSPGPLSNLSPEHVINNPVIAPASQPIQARASLRESRGVMSTLNMAAERQASAQERIRMRKEARRREREVQGG